MSHEITAHEQYQPYIPDEGPLGKIANLAMVVIGDEDHLASVVTRVGYLLQDPEGHPGVLIEGPGGRGAIRINSKNTTADVYQDGVYSAPTPDFFSMITTWLSQDRRRDAA